MAKDNGQVNIGAGTFAPGTKVSLHDRLGDARSGRSAKSATIGTDGTASFSSLKPGRQFWLVGEDELGRRVEVAATAKAPAAPQQPVRDPEAVHDDLRAQALDQGSTNAPPVEGMRSSANVAPKAPDQAQRNKETMESAQRTKEALAKQDLQGAQVDRMAASEAGIVTATDPNGAAVLVSSAPAKSSAAGSTAAARSAAAKKAAATRRRNARQRSQAAKKAAQTRASGKK